MKPASEMININSKKIPDIKVVIIGLLSFSERKSIHIPRIENTRAFVIIMYSHNPKFVIFNVEKAYSDIP